MTPAFVLAVGMMVACAANSAFVLGPGACSEEISNLTEENDGYPASVL